MPEMVFDEAGDEEIAVVVTWLHAQGQRVIRSLGRLNQHLGFELVDQKIITIALIDQGRQLFGRLRNQHAGIPLAPARTVFAQITGECLLPQGQSIGLLIGENADTER